jgi:putative acetyltransferase
MSGDRGQRMTVRRERRSDRRAVANVHRQAFPGEPVPGFVDAIRESPHHVPRYSLVCEHEAQLIGHVQLSYVDVQDGERRHRVLALTPLGVLPEHQRRGAGTSLVEHVLRLADEAGEPVVILEGIPQYYPRFGFVPGTALGIEFPAHVPPAAAQAKKLRGYRPDIRGAVRYPAAYRIVGE